MKRNFDYSLNYSKNIQIISLKLKLLLIITSNLSIIILMIMSYNKMVVMIQRLI